jgi:hypothetical protein
LAEKVTLTRVVSEHGWWCHGTGCNLGCKEKNTIPSIFLIQTIPFDLNLKIDEDIHQQ